MGNIMAEKLVDENGKLKPFRQWKEEVTGIASHFVGPWLQTEYNTAVIRAHNAADWLNFERNKDIFPNLRWMPTTSPNPEESHRLFWERKVTRPINDPFWNKHRPGDRWNCKCTLEATDDPITDIPGETDKERPQPGLKENPAKTKQIFDKSHPYFPKSCKGCKFNLGSFKNFFNVAQGNNCYNCRQIHTLFLSNMPIKDIRKHILSNKLFPVTSGSHDAPNLLTGKILTSQKVVSRLVAHIRNYEEYEASDYIWNNIDKLVYYKKSPLGINKNMDDIKDAKNISRKKERGVVSYHIYSFKYQNETWILKTEEHKKGFEQPYAIYKKNPKAAI